MWLATQKLNSKLLIVIFQINTISLIKSDILGKPRVYEFE